MVERNNSTGQRRSRIRKRSCPTLSFGVVASLSLMAPSEARIPQHRVKRPHRTVPYQKVHPDFQSSKFWIPNSRSDKDVSGTKIRSKDVQTSFPQESTSIWNDENGFWHFHLTAKHVHGGDDRRRMDFLTAGFEVEDPTELEEEETYQDSLLGSDTNQTWNVSTEIDYGGDLGNSSTNATIVFSTSESDSDGNSTMENAFQPLRIRVILPDDESSSRYLSDTKRAVLFGEILSPAILAWSAALRVNPVVGNLTVDPSQLSDGVSCGPGMESGHPSVLVAPEHMTIGLANTDFVVYLSLSFSGQNNQSQANQTQANQTQANQKTAVEDDSSSPDSRGQDKSENSGSGSDKLDTNEFLQHLQTNKTGLEDSDLYCAGDYLAAATYCSTDQNDRPTAALMHLCIGPDFFEEKRMKRNIITVMHELGHALGFNPQSMAHFRHSDGSPITERDDDGNVVDQVVECAGPKSRKRFATVALPSEDIIQFTTVRGGVRVAGVVTPSVKQVVRNHFDCQMLEGAELESGNVMFGEEESTDSCIGDHWERRLFRTDLMNAIVDDVTFKLRISPVTLALFADSGWYQVDLSRTAFVDGWGRGAGCSFVEDDCVAPDGRILDSNKPFFCNEIADTTIRGSLAQIQGCSPDMSRKAVCSIAQYDAALPSEYQYFNLTFGSNVGGNEPLLDYCPVYSGFSNGQCKDPSSTILTVSEIEEFGSRNSRCLNGHLSGQHTALCVPIACVVEDRSLRIQVDGKWQLCTFTGQQFSTKKGGVTTHVTCPDVIRACPTFHCDRSCLGTDGMCDYTTGKCMCAVPDGNDVVVDGRSTTQCDITIPEASLGIFFEDPLLHKKNSTRPHIPEDSPLADYYVPHQRVLINRRRRPFLIPYIVGSIIVFICGVIVTVFLVRSKKHEDVVNAARRTWTRVFGRLPNDNGNIEDEDGLELTWPPRPEFPFRLNKDKFVASMLQDMRIHHPQEEEGSGAMSVPDTSAETDSNANMSRCDRDHDLASDSCQSDISNQQQEIPPPQLMRRRFKSELV